MDSATTLRPWGVNVAGYLASDLGIGEAARQVILALDAHEVPVAPIRYVAGFSPRTEFAAMSTEGYPFAVTVACVNADGFPSFAQSLSEDTRRYRYTIGLWFWEVDTFPERWRASFEYVDEVWAASSFVAEAVGADAPVPVNRVTLPIEPRLGALLSRERLGMPPGFTYLFLFDYNSVFARKNPLAVVEAFTAAHPRPGEASLVLKSVNHERAPEHHAQLMAACAGRPDITLVDHHVSVREKNAMLASCDCYVSLHRSEGLGMTMGEAMRLAKPVVATGYSGNLDFMTAENSFLVDYELVAVGDQSDPYPPDARWAQPDVEHAAALMRQVFETPELAKRRGLNARADMEATHSVGPAGASMVERLADVRDRVPERPGAGPFPDAMLGGVGTAAIQSRVRRSWERDSSRRGVRAAATSALARLLRRFAAHQREVDEEIVAAIDALLGATARGLERLHQIDASAESELLAALRRLERRMQDDQAEALNDLVLRWASLAPHREPYLVNHGSFIAGALDDPHLLESFARRRRLPPGYGISLDERVVELPWVVAARPAGRMLDAGSALMHAHVIERLRPLVTELVMVNGESDEECRQELDVRHAVGDLRDLPYPDESFDTVACLSRLEDIGMDTGVGGRGEPPAEGPRAQALLVVGELARVTRPGGRLLITVPYGAPEDHGWGGPYDRSDIEALVERADADRTEVVVYRYLPTGWQLSALDAAAEGRALACIRIVR